MDDQKGFQTNVERGSSIQSSHLTFAVLIQSNPLNGPGSNQVFIGNYILVITL